MPIAFIVSTSLELLIHSKTITSKIDIIGKISDGIQHHRYFQIVTI